MLESLPLGEESLVNLSLAENLPLDNPSGWNTSSLNTVESLPHMRYGPLEKWATVVVVAILEKLVKEEEARQPCCRCNVCILCHLLCVGKLSQSLLADQA